MATETTHLAVFGDVHGHLRLMFQLARHWQLENHIHLDGILLCGDLGFFPNLARIDKATRKYAKRDPEELGFAYYFRLPAPSEPDAQLEQILNGDPSDLNTVGCPVVFCHGNHEDFEEMEKVTCGAVLAPVDVFGRIHLLRSGEVTELGGVRIGALGGGPEHDAAVDAPVLGPLVSSRAAARLQRKSFDVLLSHCAPHGVGHCWGSRLLTEVIHRCQPAYCLYAHHSHFIPPATIGRTKCFWHADVNFQTSGSLFQGPPEPGCMAVLRWNGPHEHRYGVVGAPWFRKITAATWRYL